MRKTLICRRRFRTLFAAATLVFTAVETATVALASKPTAVLFPVTIEPATKSGVQVVKPNEAAYIQLVRSTKAVRLTADLVVTYQSKTSALGRFIDRTGAPFTVKAGTLLVVALDQGKEMYCAAGAEELIRFVGYNDVAFCLRDNDQDGVFEQKMIFEPMPRRVRVPYEIVNTGESIWSPVSATYEVLVESDIPPLELRVRYNFRKGGLFGGNLAWLDTEICWPQPLILASAHMTNEEICGDVDWFSSVDTRVSLKKNESGTLKSSVMSIRYANRPDDMLEVEVSTILRRSRAYLFTFGGPVQSSGGNAQRAAVHLLPIAIE